MIEIAAYESRVDSKEVTLPTMFLEQKGGRSVEEGSDGKSPNYLLVRLKCAAPGIAPGADRQGRIRTGGAR